MNIFDAKSMKFAQAIFDVKFQSRPFILERRDAEKLAKKIKDVFPLRGDYAENRLTFTNNYKVNAFVQLEGVSLMMEDIESVSQFVGYINKFVPDAASIFNFSQIQRIGLKVDMYLPKENLDEAAKCFYDLVRVDEAGFSGLGVVKGFGTSVIFENNNLFTNIIINPAVKQAFTVAPISGVSAKTTVALMVSVDTFLEGGQISIGIADFTKRAMENFEINVSKFLDSVG